MKFLFHGLLFVALVNCVGVQAADKETVGASGTGNEVVVVIPAPIKESPYSALDIARAVAYISFPTLIASMLFRQPVSFATAAAASLIAGSALAYLEMTEKDPSKTNKKRKAAALGVAVAPVALLGLFIYGLSQIESRPMPQFTRSEPLNFHAILEK